MQTARLFFAVFLFAAATECLCLLTFGLYTNEVSFVDRRWMPQVEESVCQHKWEVCSRIRSDIDTLILGDSSGLMGIDPRILDEYYGLRSYNLCTVAYCSISGHNLFLKEYLRTNRPPQIIVYYFAPFELGQDDALIQQRGYLKRVRDLSEGRKLVLPPSLQLRTAVRAAVDGRHLIHEDPFVSPRGAYPSHEDLCALLDAQKGFFAERAMEMRNFTVNGFSISEAQLQGLREVAETAHRHGIRLLLVANPIPDFADSPAVRHDLEEITVKIGDSIRDTSAVSIPQPLFRFLTARSFSTSNHLHPEVVKENTVAVGKLIRKQLSP